MSTTTILSSSEIVTLTVNGSALASFPNVVVQARVVYVDNRSGSNTWTMTGNAAGRPLKWNDRPHPSGLGYAGIGTLMETFSSGSKQYNGFWSSPNPSQVNLSSYPHSRDRPRFTYPAFTRTQAAVRLRGRRCP